MGLLNATNWARSHPPFLRLAPARRILAHTRRSKDRAEAAEDHGERMGARMRHA